MKEEKLKKKEGKLRKNFREEIVLDAADAVVGRLASFAAKKAIQGNSIVVINSEKAKIIGNKKIVLEKYLARTRLGKGVQKGPIISRQPAQLLRRAIRGMLERKRTRGREAFKRVKCYEGVPQNYADKEKISVGTKEAINFLTLEQLSKHYGK